MAELDALKQEADSLLSALQGVGQQPQPEQEEVVTEQVATEAPVPTSPQSSAFSADDFSDITGQGQAIPLNESVSLQETGTSGFSANDFSDITGVTQESISKESSEENQRLLLGFTVPENLLNKETLSTEDVKDLPFESIVALADVSSPLEFGAKKQLSDALRGSTTSGLGEILVGTPFSSDDMESLLEEKYQDFIDENPDKARNIFSQLASSAMTGSPINNMISEESQTLLPQSTALINNLGQSAFGTFGEDAYKALGMENTARAIEASGQQLDENDITGDAVITDILGAVLPASGIANLTRVGAQGVTRLGNVVRGALAGSGEAALFAAGSAEGGVGERVGEALDPTTLLTGAALGGVGSLVGEGLMSAGRTVAGKFVRSIDQNRVARRSMDRLLKDINNTSRGTVNITAEDVVQGLSEGKGIQTVLAERGLRSNDIERVLNGMSSGSREMLNTIERTGSELIQTRVAQNADALNNVGQRLEISRGKISSNDVNTIIRETLDLDQGLLFEEEVLLPAAVQLIRANRDTIARKAGYTRNNATRARVHIDKESGDIFVVKPNEQGQPFTPKSDGTYESDQLYEVRPTGSFITDLRSRVSQIINPDVRAGSSPNQTVGFADYDPIQQNLGAAERRISPESAELADLDRVTRLEGDAIRQGSQGISSKREFSGELQRVTGSLSDLPKKSKDTLNQIAEEMSALSSAGKRTGSDQILPQSGLSRTLSDARIAGMFGGSLSGMSRIFILRNVVDAVRSALGSQTALSRSEQLLEPIIENLMRADDSVITESIKGAIDRGLSQQQWASYFGSIFLPASFATERSSGSQDQLFDQLGAQ